MPTRWWRKRATNANRTPAKVTDEADVVLGFDKALVWDKAPVDLALDKAEESFADKMAEDLGDAAEAFKSLMSIGLDIVHDPATALPGPDFLKQADQAGGRLTDTGADILVNAITNTFITAAIGLAKR
jgi:hypothetical protein